MASSKSTIKIVDKTELYFNKYNYKATIVTMGSYWVRLAKDMDDFIQLVSKRYEEWESHKDRYPNGWYRQPPSIVEHDLDKIEKLIEIKNLAKTIDIRFRHECDNFSLYTNDTKLIEKLLHDKQWKIEQVKQSPAGVKYFKKDPPANFRTYLTNNKVPPDFVNEMSEYLVRTADVTPSSALYDWLHRSRVYSYNYCWCHSSHFVDYNDEKNLMMMHLLFPGAIGKTYKLEKKP